MSWRASSADENLPLNLQSPDFTHDEFTTTCTRLGAYFKVEEIPYFRTAIHSILCTGISRCSRNHTMSRSAADATRFTATGPYASSKPNRGPYELPRSMESEREKLQPKSRTPQTGPDGKPETPKQKVERLRAQARAARMARSSSGIDRWLEIGRRVANKTHKGMVYSLIVASGMFLVLVGG